MIRGPCLPIGFFVMSQAVMSVYSCPRFYLILVITQEVDTIAAAYRGCDMMGVPKVAVMSGRDLYLQDPSPKGTSGSWSSQTQPSLCLPFSALCSQMTMLQQVPRSAPKIRTSADLPPASYTCLKRSRARDSAWPWPSHSANENPGIPECTKNAGPCRAIVPPVLIGSGSLS